MDLSSFSATDIIQTIVGLAGFAVLFRKDMDKEKELEKLDNIISKQHGILKALQSRAQSAEKNNKLLTEQVKALTEHFDFNKELPLQKLNQENTDRRKSLMPNFVRTSFSVGTVADFECHFLNTGHMAYHLAIGDYPQTICVEYSGSNINNKGLVKRDGKFYVRMKFLKGKLEDYKAIQFGFDILFTDEEGELYRQIVTVVNMIPKVSEPELITL